MAIIKTEIFDNFPALMQYKKSIFFVTIWKGEYYATCLNQGMKNKGTYPVGTILRMKNLSEFKRMKKGFFIEIIVED